MKKKFKLNEKTQKKITGYVILVFICIVLIL